MFVTNAQLFRAAHRVAIKDGFAHGWPSCASAARPDGRVWGTYRLPAAPWLHTQDVPRSQLQTQPDADSGQIGNLEWAAHRWASANGYLAALPTYEQAWNGHEEVLGLVLFDHNAPIDFKDVPENELHGASPLQADGKCVFPLDTWGTVNLWAFHHGYPAGYPDFEVGNNVYGTFMVQAASGIQFQDVLEADLLHVLNLNPPPRLPVSVNLVRPHNTSAPWTGTAAAFDNAELDQPITGVTFVPDPAWRSLTTVWVTHLDDGMSAQVAPTFTTTAFDGHPSRGRWQVTVTGTNLTDDCSLRITV